MEIPVKGATMVHNFALTSGHVIFMDLPVVFDFGSAMSGVSIPFSWSDSYGARLGILPRGSGVNRLPWVEVEPCYVYHVANAFETSDGTRNPWPANLLRKSACRNVFRRAFMEAGLRMRPCRISSL